jgi:hypothetical protein
MGVIRYTFKNISIFVNTLTNLANEAHLDLDINALDGPKQEFSITLSEPKNMRSSKVRYHVFKARISYEDILYAPNPKDLAKELFKFMTESFYERDGGPYCNG